MKIDELIEELESVREEHGNLEIWVKQFFGKTNDVPDLNPIKDGYEIDYSDKFGDALVLFLDND